MNTQFLNEHRWPGYIGQAFIVLAFVAALMSAISYFISTRSRLPFNEDSWRKLGRKLFTVHAVSTFGIFLTLFYIIFNHLFEYYYAWSHSSKTLPFKYLLSCFWEGQEGSFLLWSIWHAILGLLLIRKKHEWEAPVMSIVAFCQFILTSTILGYYFFDTKIGSSPFLLLREQMAGAPIFQQANYLESIPDGNGLNPLLQNYWMVIHPPILFLGFASTLFPFAYCVAALWQKRFDNLMPYLLRWSVFSGMVLGTGIMMGGAWAYESLNFGGYWAWDPVENASLVPWLVIIAGLHTAMIYKSSGYSLKSTLLFFIIAFALVLYSTFLTRTGILGETSVHSFTGEGESLFWHLIFFLSILFIPALLLFFVRYREVPDNKKEEEAVSSREFWMFIGALILMIAVVQITYTTSMPVWNKMFGTKLTITDPIKHYNSIQIIIVSFILLGTASMYYFKFKKSNMAEVWRRIQWPFYLSLILTITTCFIQHYNQWNQFPIMLLLFMAWFAVWANLNYIRVVIKGRWIKWGGTMAHTGFGLMLIGILFSGYEKRVISVNRLGLPLDIGKDAKDSEKESRENILLYKNIPLGMGGYELTYMGDTVEEPNHYYRVRYRKMENDTGRIKEEFILSPNAQINKKMGLVSSPDSKHYLTHDIFTYVTSTIDKEQMKDTTSFTTQKVKKGDSLFFANGSMVFEGFDTAVHNPNYVKEPGDIAVFAKLKVYNSRGMKLLTDPVFVIRGNDILHLTDTLTEAELITRLDRIDPKDGSAEISFKSAGGMKEYITMKAIIFPYINVLWFGTVVMILGFAISLRKRFQTK